MTAPFWEALPAVRLIALPLAANELLLIVFGLNLPDGWDR